MEEDWCHWVGQISFVLFEEHTNKTIDLLDSINAKRGATPFLGTHESGDHCLQRVSSRQLRVPLLKRNPIDSRRMGNLKIKVELKFPSYIKAPKLLSRTDFMERYRLQRPTLKNGESPKLCQKLESSVPIAPTFKVLPEVKPLSESPASDSNRRLASPTLCHDLLDALCFQANLVPLPKFPKTTIWNINPNLETPNALPMSIHGPIPIIDRRHVLPRVQLGIVLGRLKFIQTPHQKWRPVRRLEPPPSVSPPKPPNEALPACASKGPPLTPSLSNIQVIVNRDLLSVRAVMSWLESCPSSRIIERDFCTNLPVIAVSPKECIIIIDDEKRALPALDDLLFETIHVAISATTISSSQLGRINLTFALCDKSKITAAIIDDPLVVIYQRIRATQAEKTTQPVALDPELSAHERLLVSLMRINHWEAQICLQTRPNFLYQMLRRTA